MHPLRSAPRGAFYMDDVWISGRLAHAKVPRYVVPFDEDQFTMSPNLENVTTLDHVSLQTPGSKKRASAGSSQNTRMAANEQALRHFKNDWDVGWDNRNYGIRQFGKWD